MVSTFHYLTIYGKTFDEKFNVEKIDVISNRISKRREKKRANEKMLQKSIASLQCNEFCMVIYLYKYVRICVQIYLCMWYICICIWHNNGSSFIPLKPRCKTEFTHEDFGRLNWFFVDERTKGRRRLWSDHTLCFEAVLFYAIRRVRVAIALGFNIIFAIYSKIWILLSICATPKENFPFMSNKSLHVETGYNNNTPQITK